MKPVIRSYPRKRPKRNSHSIKSQIASRNSDSTSGSKEIVEGCSSVCSARRRNDDGVSYELHTLLKHSLQSFGQDDRGSHGSSSSSTKTTNLLERKYSTNDFHNNTIDGTFLSSCRRFCSTLKLQEECVQIDCLKLLLNFIRDHHGIDSPLSLLQEVRGALSIAGIILKKSKACRRYFCSTGATTTVKQNRYPTSSNESSSSSSPLCDFVQRMNSVVLEPAAAVTMSTKTKLCSHHHKLLFQKEALDLLAQLADQFGQLYPHFIVALRFLQERKGIFNIMHLTKDSTNNSSTTKRVGGGLSQYALATSLDASLNYGERHCQHIMKIVSKMKECFEILVPRFDTQNCFEISNAKDNNNRNDNICSTSTTPTIIQKQNPNINDPDEDNDDVDWEEGDETIDTPSSRDDVTHLIKDQCFAAAAQAHEAAVERTLLAALGGSGLHDYTVNINFDYDDEEEVDRSSIEEKDVIVVPAASTEKGKIMPSFSALDKDSGQQVKKKLIHLTEKLCQRHLPVLDVWIEALQDLTSTDGLKTTETHEMKKMQKHSIIKLKELFRTVKFVASSTVDQSYKFINREEHSKGRASKTCHVNGINSAYESLREESTYPFNCKSLHVLPWKRNQSIEADKQTARRIKIAVPK
jgi:hypothetical protein